MVVLEGIARGEMAVAKGRVVSHADAKACMAKWLEPLNPAGVTPISATP